VRHCGVRDAMALRSMRLEALLDSPQAYGSTYQECLAWTNRQWRNVCRDWNHYLGEQDGRVVGVASGGVNDRYPSTLWLYGMYVTPRARGTGIAKQLVEVVAQWARDQGVSSLYLHVAAPMIRARTFYERMGFRATGDVMVMDRDPVIELVTMVMTLV
jgi:GNAT superfamily N-acetyltransferase